MLGRRCVAVFALAAACGGSEPAPVVTHTPQPTATATHAPPPVPHDQAKKLVMTSAACFVGQLWLDAEGDAATSAQRSTTARQCKSVVRDVVGQDDPSEIEALRMFDASITAPLASKVKELAASDGLDADHEAELSRFGSAIVAAAREAANARRAAAKIRADIEKIKSDRQKRAARDRVAVHLTASEAAAVPALRSGAALRTLLRTTASDYAGDAQGAGLVLALVRVRAAQDLPRHIKLYTAAPAYAAVFDVPPPPLPERTKERLKPGAWLAYVTAVAKACGHPVDKSVPGKEREPLAWNAVFAGFDDRLEAAQPKVEDPDLAAIVRAAAARLKAPPAPR
jgi:hypothetical protein